MEAAEPSGPEGAGAPAAPDQDRGGADLVRQLRAEVTAQEDRLAALTVELQAIDEEHAGALRERLIDAALGPLVTSRSRIVASGTALAEDLRDLARRAEPFRNALQRQRLLRERLALCQKVVEAAEGLPKLNDQLTAALAGDDLAAATRAAVAFRRLDDEKFLARDADGVLISSLENNAASLERTVEQQFQAAVAERNTQRVHAVSRLLGPLRLHARAEAYLVRFWTETATQSARKALAALEQDSKWAGKKRPAGFFATALEAVLKNIRDVAREQQKTMDAEGSSGRVLSSDGRAALLQGLSAAADSVAVPLVEQFRLANSDVLAEAPADGQPSESAFVTDLQSADVVLEELVTLAFRINRFSAYLKKAGVSGETPSSSKLMTTGQELLGVYVAVEPELFARYAAQALENPEFAASEPPLVTTAPDDVFFILKKSLARAVASADVHALCAVINLLAARVAALRVQMTSAVDGAMRLFANSLDENAGPGPVGAEGPGLSGAAGAPRFLQQIAANVAAAVPVAAGDAAPASSPAPALPDLVRSWPDLMNDLAAAAADLERVLEDLRAEVARKWPSRGSEQRMVEACVASQFDPLAAEFGACLDQCARDLVRYLLVDENGAWAPLLRDITDEKYELTEEEYSNLQEADEMHPADQLVAGVAGFIDTVRAETLPDVFRRVVGALAAELAAAFERCVRSNRFTFFGAVFFDDVLRRLVAVSTSAAVAGKPLRLSFARALEMAEILNLRTVEELRSYLSEMWRAGAARSGGLTASESKAVARRRVDLPEEAVTRAYQEQLLLF